MVLPEDLRFSLWFDTIQRVREPPKEDALPAPLDLEFAFELTWRLERCLCPVFDNQVSFLEATVERYSKLPDPEASTQSPQAPMLHGTDFHTQELSLDAMRYKCHYLLLTLMRHYREEGLSAKWDEACNRVQAVLPRLSPEHNAQFQYERAMFALFALNIRQLNDRLAEWSHNDALPFWEARKAGLLAEIGRVREATHILEESLETIRAKLNLSPLKKDYTLVSQESFVMYLLNVVRQDTQLTPPNQSETQRQRREFRERWHALKQYKCDPWQELKTFEHKLRGAPMTTSNLTETPTFDIGRFVQTHHWRGWDEEALTAYNFLRFCEDTGIPFRVAHCKIATESATGAVTRIARHSSYWALATVARTGDANAVDAIFDRAYLVRMSTPTVDSLIERYLESLRLAAPDIAMGNRWDSPNFGTVLAQVLPEILSRLCCKSSRLAREKLINWLIDVYGSKHRSNYQGIRHLIQRLLDASPIRERVATVPNLLQFPILPDLDPIEEREYRNPFSISALHGELPVDESTASAPPLPSLDPFFNHASSHNPAGRRWAVSALETLHRLRLLGPAASRRFAEVLWSRVDDHGLPSDTDYYRFAFLSLPHPADVEPTEGFIRYVRSAQFPAQQSETRTVISTSDDDCRLCHEIVAASEVQWCVSDVRAIVNRLLHWWDADKTHLSKRPVNDPDARSFFPSIGVTLRRRLSALVTTLSTMILRFPDSVNDEPARSAVIRVATECDDRDLPALQLEVACAYVLGRERSLALQRVEYAMASPDEASVIDALEAMNLVARYGVTESNRGDLRRLVRETAQMIRWRRETALWAALKAAGDVVKTQPWALTDDVEGDMVMGLGYLIGETTIGAGRNAEADGNSVVRDVSRSLLVRRAAARLAYRLFESCRTRSRAIPDGIGAWEAACRSDGEFLDIRNEWLAQ